MNKKIYKKRLLSLCHFIFICGITVITAAPGCFKNNKDDSQIGFFNGPIRDPNRNNEHSGSGNCSDLNNAPDACVKKKDHRGDTCAYDLEQDRCYNPKIEVVFKSSCPNIQEEKACTNRADCRYFAAVGSISARCVDASDVGKPCDEIYDQDLCTLPGYAAEKCVYVRSIITGSCAPERVIDARGFLPRYQYWNSYNFHTGTQFDIRGFDREGHYQGNIFQLRDPRGFDRNGNHRETGTPYDPLGFNLDRRTVTGGLFNEYGFNSEGVHQITGTDRDPRGFNARGDNLHTGTRYDQRGFDISGRRQYGGERDDRGFDMNGRLVDGSQYDLLGFNAHCRLADGSRYTIYGFDCEEKYRDGSNYYDPYGFDYWGEHKDTRSLYNPGGFDREGFHRDTGTRFAPDGLDMDGSTADNYQIARDAKVGAVCFIPRHPNALIYPADFRDSEHFIRYIEDRCSELNKALNLPLGTSQTARRAQLINQVKTTNRLFDTLGVVRNPVRWVSPDDRFEKFERTNRFMALEAYISSLFRDRGKSALRPTGGVSFLHTDDQGNPRPRIRPDGTFEDVEIGVDAGGLTREFLSLVADQLKPMFVKELGQDYMKIDPNFNDFNKCVNNGQAATAENCFKNIGQVFAKLALVEGSGIPNIQMPLNFLAKLLGKDLHRLSDLMAVLYLLDRRHQHFDTIMNTLRIPEDQISDLYLNYISEAGVDIEVNTKAELLECMRLEAKSQVDPKENHWFAEGFLKLFPNVANSKLTPKELGLILQGNPAKWEDVKPRLIFTNDSTQAFKTMFLEAVDELVLADPNFTNKLLQFITGSIAPPNEGTDIEIKVYNHLSIEKLPEGHTCYNYVIIPPYLTKEMIQEKLEIAVFEGVGSFEIS